MRAVLYGGAALAILAISSVAALQSAIAASASALVEAAPFLMAGIALARLLPRGHHAIAYLGCGCARGPSARSLPAMAAAWLAFGPAVAVARFIAAIVVSRFVRQPQHACKERPTAPHLLDDLSSLLPSAMLSSVSLQLFAALHPSKLSPGGDMIAGMLFGFMASSCGLGAIAVAGTLRVAAPAAAAAFLCVAGIADLRTFCGQNRRMLEHDALGYALTGIALCIVAQRHGSALVHPAFTPALWICAVATFAQALRYARRRCGAARIAPALMLVGVVIGAPAPQYRATETTLSDLFPGERLTFTGAVSCDRFACALVRYAITCCRADATPVAVRLAGAPHDRNGSWLRVDGRIAVIGGELRLVPQRTNRIAPPSDPFVYR